MSPVARYRQMIRDGADPDPHGTYMAARTDDSRVVRSPSTQLGRDLHDANPGMDWDAALRAFTAANTEYKDTDEFWAGFHGNR